MYYLRAHFIVVLSLIQERDARGETETTFSMMTNIRISQITVRIINNRFVFSERSVSSYTHL